MKKSNNNINIIMESIDDTVREHGESQSDMSIS